MSDEGKGGVIVTGGARCIGLAIAKSCVAQGYGVIISDVDQDAGMQAAAQIDPKLQTAMSHNTDVTNRSFVTEAVATCERVFGFLHGMVNNAGFNKPQSFLETTEDNWRQIMSVNGLGVMIGIQEAAKAIIARGHKGKIINTASMAGRTGFGDFAPYCASKAAVINLTQATARALAEHGITVNAFGPGVVATELWDKLDTDLMEMGASSAPGEAMENFSAGIPLGRVSIPEDVAGTVDFLFVARIRLHDRSMSHD